MKFKATYRVIYKAEFEHKKKLSNDSIVYKRHDNNFDLDIYFVRLYYIIRFHDITARGLEYFKNIWQIVLQRLILLRTMLYSLIYVYRIVMI